MLGYGENEMETKDNKYIQCVKDWQHGEDNFGAKLVALYSKGDTGNRARLGKGFDGLGEAFNAWFMSEAPFNE